MYRIIILIFILTNFVFSQKLFESHQVDSLNNSDFEKMYSINVMYSSYTPGVEEDAHLGHTLGVIYFYKFIYPYFNEFKFKIGLFLINQKSLKSCEQIGKKNVDFYQPVLYFKTEYSSYFKHFMYKIGIALNTASESDLTCHNEIYFHPILINLELGLGDIDDFYFNIGINNDFEINKSSGTYSLFCGGINYIINIKDYIRLNYYFNRDNFHHERFYNGWILKSHYTLNDKYGLNTNFYYSNYINGFTINFGITFFI